MTQQALPAEVVDFINTYINSIEQLEILLLLRSAPSADWSARRVCETLRTNESSTAHRLAELATYNILVATGESPILYRYALSSDSLDKTVAALAVAYVDFRFRVIDAILAKPSEYVRVYADAFRIRKG